MDKLEDIVINIAIQAQYITGFLGLLSSAQEVVQSEIKVDGDKAVYKYNAWSERILPLSKKHLVTFGRLIKKLPDSAQVSLLPTVKSIEAEYRKILDAHDRIMKEYEGTTNDR